MKWTVARHIKARELFVREPWRAYFPWKPNDMPPRGGNPRRLAKLEKEFKDDAVWTVPSTDNDRGGSPRR